MAHPVTVCSEAARLYTAWADAVEQIPGGQYDIPIDGDPNGLQMAEILLIVNQADSAERQKRAYFAHVIGCRVCGGGGAA